MRKLFSVKSYRTVATLLLCLLLIVSASVAIFYAGWKYDNKYTRPRHSARMGMTWLDAAEYSRNPFLYLIDGWAFYDGFHTPEELAAGAVTPAAYFYLGRYGGFDLGETDAPRHGAATYRMTVITGSASLREYALELTEIFSRWNLWVNGELMQSVGMGMADAPRSSNSPAPADGMITFKAAETVEIVVAVESVPGDLYSGMVYPPAFGSPEAVSRQITQRLLVHCAAAAVALLLGFLCLLTGAGLRFKRPYGGMFLLCLCFAVYTAWPLFTALGMRGVGWSMAERLSYYGMILFVIYFHGRLAGIPKHVFLSACGAALGVCLLVLLQPLLPMTRAGGFYLFGNALELWKWLAAVYLIGASVWAIKERRAGAGLLLAGFAVFAAALLSDRLWPLYEPIIFGWPQETAGFVLVIVFTAALAWDTVRVYRDNLFVTEQKKRSDAELEANRRYAALQQEYVTRSEQRLHETRGRYLVLRHYAEAGQQQKLLDALNSQIGENEHEGPRYSDNALLDAILHTQFSRAFDAGVYVEYRLTGIRAALPVEDADLASLLTNMLDNAVRAAESAEHEKWLHISIELNGDSFDIHCANAKGSAPPQKRRGHGYGLSIMKDIAEKYGGVLETEDLGHSFEIRIKFL